MMNDEYEPADDWSNVVDGWEDLSPDWDLIDGWTDR